MEVTTVTAIEQLVKERLFCDSMVISRSFTLEGAFRYRRIVLLLGVISKALVDGSVDGLCQHCKPITVVNHG